MPFLATLLDYARTTVVFLFMISVLVAAHEYGHYLFARIFKMSIEEFAIGFGTKPLWVWMRKSFKVKLTPEQVEQGFPDVVETKYTIRPWPLGGFVRIAGMEPKEDGSEVNIPGGFYGSPPLQRFIVLLAGPTFSVLAGMALLFVVFITWGIPTTKDPVISSIEDDMPAQQAGMQVGDRVLAINGKAMDTAKEISDAIHAENGKPVTVTFTHGKDSKTVYLVPQLSKKPGSDFPRLGLAWDAKLVPVSAGEAVVLAAEAPLAALKGFQMIFQRKIPVGDAVGGPATMVDATHQAVNGGVGQVISLAAELSISVGFLNLLPFGVFDGGQMLLAVVEMLRRKRPSLKAQYAYFSVGLVLICGMILSVLFIDGKRYLPFGKPPPSAQQQAAAPAPSK